MLDALALQTPAGEHDAIIYVQTGEDPQHISRSHFRSAVHQCAQSLKTLGIKPRDLVVIAHTQNLESIYAFWGALLVGAVPSMFPTLTEKLDPQIYMRNMAELVTISAVRAVLTTDDFAPILAQNVSCAVYGSEQLANALGESEQDDFQPLVPDPDQTAFLQHSSGTTGLQKGVALSHRAVLNQLAHYGDAINLNTRDVVVSWLPLYHDMGLIAGFLLPLVQGIPLVLMSPFDWVRHPALLLRAVDEHRGTLCWLPNFAYNHSARRIRQRDGQGYSLASMRLFINCSEPVRHDSHELFLQRFAANGLKSRCSRSVMRWLKTPLLLRRPRLAGSAALDIIDRRALEENNLASPIPGDHPDAVHKVSCGTPIAGTKIRVVINGLIIQEERQVGEIAIKSDCMLTSITIALTCSPSLMVGFSLAIGDTLPVGRSISSAAAKI